MIIIFLFLFLFIIVIIIPFLLAKAFILFVFSLVLLKFIVTFVFCFLRKGENSLLSIKIEQDVTPIKKFLIKCEFYLP